MADFTIGRFNVIAGNGFATTQMRIRRLSPYAILQRFRRGNSRSSQARRIERWAPKIGTTPIVWIPVIPEECGLVLPRDGPLRVDIAAFLNLLFRQRHIQSLGWPVCRGDGHWRDQHRPPAKPAAGVNREVADCPCLIVEIELIHSPKLTVRSSDHKT